MSAVEDLDRTREEQRVAAVARAICCPDGCQHPPDADPSPHLTRMPCFAVSYRREAIAAMRICREFANP